MSTIPEKMEGLQNEEERKQVTGNRDELRNKREGK
jgi:hypothetical protein